MSSAACTVDNSSSSTSSSTSSKLWQGCRENGNKGGEKYHRLLEMAFINGCRSLSGGITKGWKGDVRTCCLNCGLSTSGLPDKQLAQKGIPWEPVKAPRAYPFAVFKQQVLPPSSSSSSSNSSKRCSSAAVAAAAALASGTGWTYIC